MRNTPAHRRRLFRAAPALATCLWLSTTLPGLGCDADAPGWRDAAGACVTWRTLEDRCGLPPSTRCTPDAPDPRAERLIVTPKGDPSLPPCRGCGCKGGPGWRHIATGRCVGFRELASKCGDPPSSELCTFENAPGTGANRECALAPAVPPSARKPAERPSP